MSKLLVSFVILLILCYTFKNLILKRDPVISPYCKSGPWDKKRLAYCCRCLSPLIILRKRIGSEEQQLWPGQTKL